MKEKEREKWKKKKENALCSILYSEFKNPPAVFQEMKLKFEDFIIKQHCLGMEMAWYLLLLGNFQIHTSEKPCGSLVGF